MKVAVGSKNPVKIAAARQAFAAIWPHEEISIVSSDVPSGVSDQPMSTEESIKGAINRAKTVKVALRPDYAVGIEAGSVKVGDQWFEDGWVAVIDQTGSVGLGGSPRIQIAPKLMKLIKSGQEFGEAGDAVFGTTGMKQSSGYCGMMTGNVFTRTDMLCDAIIMALGRFVRPDVF